MSTNLTLIRTTNLAQAIGLRPGDTISLVGGGGKTSLMFRLAHELAAGGESVITTTTTRILPPTPEESPCVILDEDVPTLIRRATEALQGQRHITLARPDSNKLRGLSPETIDSLRHLRIADYIINEADGASCRPLKAPNPTEPIIPTSTSLVVAIVGIEAIGRPLLPENAFRIENITRLTGLNEGESITTEAVAQLLTHHEGIIQHASGMCIVPFINKAGEDQVTQAETLAAEILCRRHQYIERVVFGELKRPAYPLTIALPDMSMVGSGY